MSSVDPKPGALDAPYTTFATSLLPLYSDAPVTIRIGTTGKEYKLPKALLCKQSPYFAAMFEGDFQEAKDQSTTLSEIDDVVSTRSFELLVQWLYLGRVVFGKLKPIEEIEATIEFVRIADMCGVTGMESQMAERIKDIIIANTPSDTSFSMRDSDINTRCILSQHIKSASFLPEGHPVRRILAMAAVKGFLRSDKFDFRREAQEVPNFAVDLLSAVKSSLKTLRLGGISKKIVVCDDPLTGLEIRLEMSV